MIELRWDVRARKQGFRSVDVAVLWPKGYTQFHIVRPRSHTVLLLAVASAAYSRVRGDEMRAWE